MKMLHRNRIASGIEGRLMEKTSRRDRNLQKVSMILSATLICLRLVFKFCIASKLAKGHVLISSPKITSWGTWGEFEFCKNGMFVTGMRLKIDPLQCGGDNTGLNGIRFLCEYFEHHGNISDQHSHYIHSEVGEWGHWGNNYTCRTGLAVGFQLRSQTKQGTQDDFGATNLRILCSSDEIIEGDGSEWGYWTESQICPIGYAVCALRTQVEEPQGGQAWDNEGHFLEEAGEQ